MLGQGTHRALTMSVFTFADGSPVWLVHARERESASPSMQPSRGPGKGEGEREKMLGVPWSHKSRIKDQDYAPGTICSISPRALRVFVHRSRWISSCAHPPPRADRRQPRPYSLPIPVMLGEEHCILAPRPSTVSVLYDIMFLQRMAAAVFPLLHCRH